MQYVMSGIFGDGSSMSEDIAPVHTYNEPGEFIVSLRAYTEDDQVSTENPTY